MSVGLVGEKVGMTRVFTDEGESIPVTVIKAQPNRVARVKDLDSDGYCAIQVTAGEKKSSRLSKPASGHFAACGVEAGTGLWEFRLPVDAQYEVGQVLTVEVFAEGQIVDVSGTTKGKGFAGGVKRHNFKMQDATHGNSVSHRAPGSIGQNQTPGRVFKGKKMAGHMGDKQRTVQNLRVVKVDAERDLILIRGGVPGAIGGTVFVNPAVKK